MKSTICQLVIDYEGRLTRAAMVVLFAAAVVTLCSCAPHTLLKFERLFHLSERLNYKA